MTEMRSYKWYCHNKLCPHTQKVWYGNKVPSSQVCEKCGFKTVKQMPPSY